MKKTTMALMAMLICFGQANYAGAQSFSVSPTKKVIFSPGNLQWSADGTHTTATGSAPGSWQFATRQDHYIGSDNEKISSSYIWWIDLFGWATSGYTNGGWGSEPYNTSIDPHSYTLQYGIDMSGTNHDWGTFNAIYNPKTDEDDAPGTWRTLTKEEWEYLFTSRTDAEYKCGDAEIEIWGGKRGIVILPDNWTLPNGLTFNYGFNKSDISSYVSISKNTYTEEQWKQMEDAGAVFLPAAGIREPSRIIPYVGAYWSSTFYNPSGDESGRENSTRAYCIFFDSKGVKPNDTNYVNFGFSVRLVRDVKD